MRTRDGRELRVERHGDGRPVVVFEAGMGASHHCWGAVVPAVAERTTTIAYDRSGLGQSPPDTERRTLGRLADDLSDLLDHLGDGPFVLVGHSWGGPIVRTAADQTPERIAGLVLVDATDEGCDLFFGKGAERQTRMMSRLSPALARVGVFRRFAIKFAAGLPEPAAAGMRAEDGTVEAARTQVAELRSHVDDLRALRDDPPGVPEVPVTVISGLKTGFMERGRRPELVAAHRARAAALPQGRHIGAEHSSHYIPFTDPDLITTEILRIIDGVPYDHEEPQP